LRTRDLLAALDDRVGGTVLKPFMPREGRDADLVILRTTKGARAPFRLAAPLLIHEGARHVSDGEDYTDSVRSVLRDAAPIDF
ncbi:MAG: methyltransferase, partial [Pseudomonadota bacterium]